MICQVCVQDVDYCIERPCTVILTVFSLKNLFDSSMFSTFSHYYPFKTLFAATEDAIDID